MALSVIAAAIPATCVPCPARNPPGESTGEPDRDISSRFTPGAAKLRSACPRSQPESITAMTISARPCVMSQARGASMRTRFHCSGKYSSFGVNASGDSNGICSYRTRRTATPSFFRISALSSYTLCRAGSVSTKQRNEPRYADRSGRSWRPNAVSAAMADAVSAADRPGRNATSNTAGNGQMRALRRPVPPEYTGPTHSAICTRP